MPRLAPDRVARDERMATSEASNPEVGAKLLYALHRASAAEIQEALERAQIPCLFFKGLHLAPLLYDPPWMRVGSDIDLLVGRPDLPAAEATLDSLGFRPAPDRLLGPVGSVWYRGGVRVDLQWSAFGLAALTEPSPERLLRERERNADGVAVLGQAITPAVLLLHTLSNDLAFANARRLEDLHRWLCNYSVDWSLVSACVEAAQLEPIAWALLGALRHDRQTPIPETVLTRWRPPYWQRRALHAFAKRGKQLRTLQKSHPHWVRLLCALTWMRSPSRSLRWFVDPWLGEAAALRVTRRILGS